MRLDTAAMHIGAAIEGLQGRLRWPALSKVRGTFLQRRRQNTQVHEAAMIPPSTPDERTGPQSAAHRIEDEERENEGHQLPGIPVHELDDETMLMYGLFGPMRTDPELHGVDRNCFCNSRKQLFLTLVPHGQPRQPVGAEFGEREIGRAHV